MEINNKDLKEGLNSIIGGILKVAQKEREESEPYKDMFKRTSGKPFPVQLSEVNSKLTSIILDYDSILRENGIKTTAATYRFLVALPLLADILEKDITEKEGSATRNLYVAAVVLIPFSLRIES